MRKVRADLHLHTCLSPCADAQMQATAIVIEAIKAGLDMIGISDHNSAENVAAVVKAGAREGLPVIAGMEITSSEEVHILGLFDTEQDLMNMQDVIYHNLPDGDYGQAYGPQTVIDEWDNVVGENSRLLLGATALTVEGVVDAIHERSGVAIASHIDRERFGLIGQLGFIPEGLELDALEVSSLSSIEQEFDYPIVTFSDAHYLDDIGNSSTCFMIEEASIDEIRKALRNEMGRRVVFN
ncbi:MAG: PHP domain-containing protein [Phycisphaerae bacterium]|nr:PHP domain-containing protein [Phycisphaerae bacterium]NIW94195.1 PHP domain-containing protein [Phycisphaerae bacterium]